MGNTTTEEMNNIKINLNENKYSAINNLHNNVNLHSRSENNQFQNSDKNKGLYNEISNDNYFNNDHKSNNEFITTNSHNNSSNSNVQRSIIKKVNNNAHLLNRNSFENENNCNKLTFNITHVSNTKRVPLGNSEIHKKALSSNHNSINLNITPDNKKNKVSCLGDQNTLKKTETNYKGYSFSELQYMDKENNPPIPRESSRIMNKNEESSPLEINIELGISHLNSDQHSQRTLEIPITIDTKYCYEEKENFKNDAEIPLVKEYLIIFNTLTVGFEQMLEFLRLAADKMNINDKLFSNIFTNETWLQKGDLEYLLDLPDKGTFFQNTNYLNTEGIIQAIEYCVEISLENNSNVFSVIIINELRDFYSFNSNNIKEDLHKIALKLKEKRVLMVKNFSINTIILNGNLADHMSLEEKKNSEIEKFKFISFLNQLSSLTMGFNYVVKVLVNILILN